MAMNQPAYYNGYNSYQPQQPYQYQDQLSQLRGMQYQPQIAQPMQQPQQTVNQGLLWVQGEAGAKSYLVAPNTTVLLMDSENQRFYIKSTDGAGMPSMRTFEYMEINPNSQAIQAPMENLDNKYVTRTEYQRQFSEIMDRLDTLTASKAPTTRKTAQQKEVTANE